MQERSGLANSDLGLNGFKSMDGFKSICFPNTGRLGGKSKVSDLNGWPSFQTNLKTKVKMSKSFFPASQWLGTVFLETPRRILLIKERAASKLLKEN